MLSSVTTLWLQYCKPRWCQSSHLLPTWLLPNASGYGGSGGLPASSVQLAQHQDTCQSRPLPRGRSLHRAALHPLWPWQVGGESDWKLRHSSALNPPLLARYNNMKAFGIKPYLVNYTTPDPGLLHLSHPALPSRPLASLLDTLYLPSYDTRKTILDLVYKSLRLQVRIFFFFLI